MVEDLSSWGRRNAEQLQHTFGVSRDVLEQWLSEPGTLTADAIAGPLLPHVSAWLGTSVDALRTQIVRIELDGAASLLCRSQTRAPYDVQASVGFLMFAYGLANFMAVHIQPWETYPAPPPGAPPPPLGGQWESRFQQFVKDAMTKGLAAVRLSIVELAPFQANVSSLLTFGAETFAFAHEFGHIILATAPNTAPVSFVSHLFTADPQGRLPHFLVAQEYVAAIPTKFDTLFGAGWRDAWTEELACDLIGVDLAISAFDDQLRQRNGRGLAGTLATIEQGSDAAAPEVGSLSLMVAGVNLLLVGFQIFEEWQRAARSPTHPHAGYRRALLRNVSQVTEIGPFLQISRLLDRSMEESVAPLLHDHQLPFDLDAEDDIPRPPASGGLLARLMGRLWPPCRSCGARDQTLVDAGDGTRQLVCARCQTPIVKTHRWRCPQCGHAYFTWFFGERGHYYTHCASCGRDFTDGDELRIILKVVIPFVMLSVFAWTSAAVAVALATDPAATRMAFIASALVALAFVAATAAMGYRVLRKSALWPDGGAPRTP